MNFRFPPVNNTPSDEKLREFLRGLYDEPGIREVVHRHLILCSCDHEEECGILWDLCSVSDGTMTREVFIDFWNRWEHEEIERGEVIRKRCGDGICLPTPEENLEAFKHVIDNL